MDIQQIKYILEIARTGSISKASENLFVSQPHLSANLKKIEDELGINIFERTHRGVLATKEGQNFLKDAQSLVKSFNHLEMKYAFNNKQIQSLSISARRSSYLTLAISKYINQMLLEQEHLLVKYSECTNCQVIENVNNGNADVGIIRFSSEYRDHFEHQLHSRYIHWRKIYQTSYVVLMEQTHPLAHHRILNYEDLIQFTEVVHGDFEDNLFLNEFSESRLGLASKQKIYVYERSSLLDFIANVQGSYAWTTATHPRTLDMYHLVERPVNSIQSECLDYIIYKKDHVSPELLGQLGQVIDLTIKDLMSLQ